MTEAHVFSMPEGDPAVVPPQRPELSLVTNEQSEVATAPEGDERDVHATIMDSFVARPPITKGPLSEQDYTGRPAQIAAIVGMHGLAKAIDAVNWLRGRRKH